MSYTHIGNVPIGIFLDDERIPSDVYWMDIEIYPNSGDFNNWVIVRNKEDFMSTIKDLYIKGVPEDYIYLSFDHDLALWDKDGNEINGKSVVKEYINFLMDNEPNYKLPPAVNITYHTQNPEGKVSMESYIENYRKSLNNKEN